MGLFRLLHHWLVPHEGNNHRAKALHHEALFAYILILGIFNLGIRILHTAAPDVLGYATDIRVEQLLASTNVKRQEAGLEPLSINSALSQAAAQKAADMFANNYWAHNSPSGKTPWDFVVASGYRYTLAGENLAKNFQTSDGVVDAWMNSPTHKANIIKPTYRDIGFAVVNGVLNGEETTLVVQMFGTTNISPVAQIPKAQAAAPQPMQGSEGAEQKTAEKEAVVLPVEPAAQSMTPISVPAGTIASSFMQGLSFERVIITPQLNIKTVTHAVAYIMAGILIGLLAVDIFIVRKKHIIRLAGHNVTHILFLGTIVISGLALTRGSLL